MSARTGTVLDRIISETCAELERRKHETPLAVLMGDIARRELSGAGTADSAARGRFHEALAGPGIAIIAEFKRRSPSAGSLSRAPELAPIVGAYERGGASALSILTEGPNFGGSLDDLRAARALSRLPILRKDFVVDPYQLAEARAAGADAVLLIVAALEQAQLADLHARAHELGLDALVEVHDAQELTRALDVGASLIGVNNRDLRDFTVDVGRTSTLMGHVPAGVTVVSESGIGSSEQLGELERQGVAAVLVGESLMRSEDPRRTLAEFQSFRKADAAL